MEYIDIHVHMVSRTTDDYAQMALTGCVAVTEPAFWPGWDRRSITGFEDYFRQLTDFEPRRAALFRIQHYTWLSLNSREAEDRDLALSVLARIPRYLDRPTVLGIGEIGLHSVTRNEIETFKDHVDLALDHGLLMLVQTPPLEDKYRGTRLLVETLARDDRVEPGRVLIDHAEEHTIAMILDHGFWAGLTLDSQRWTSPQRAIDIVEQYGPERICIASACDWRPSTPLAIPQFALEMRRRGQAEELIRRIVFGNPAAFLGQSPRFRLPEGRSAAAARLPLQEGETSRPVPAGGGRA